MKTYNKNIVKLIQDVLSKNSSALEQQEYGFFNRLNMAGVRIELSKDSAGNHIGQIVMTNNNIDSGYISVWRTYAPGKFLIRDWKNQVLDHNGMCPYYIVRFEYQGAHMKAMLRELFEDDEKLKEEYTDVKCGNRVYTIIKICNEDITEDMWLTTDSKKRNLLDSTELDEIDIIDNGELNDVITTMF